MTRSPDEALATLKEGNTRFVNGTHRGRGCSRDVRRALAQGQSPFAAILGCSDSWVPPEVIFDQGLGDLFVVRVAGNIASQVAVGSLEYAIQHLRTSGSDSGARALRGRRRYGLRGRGHGIGLQYS